MKGGGKKNFCRVIRELPFFRTLFQIAFLWDIRKQEDCDVSEQTANLTHGFTHLQEAAAWALGYIARCLFVSKPEKT